MPEQAIDQTKKPETFLHTVIVDVPSEETQERMTRLLEVLNKVDSVEADKASRVSDYNAELKQLNKEAHKLREAITTGKEKRDVECYEKPDERRNTVFIVRASDNKVLDERAMTLEDRMYSGASKAEAEQAEQEAASPSEGQGGASADGDEAKSTGKTKGGAGKVTRIKASDVKKRKAEREAKEAADKAKKLADEQDAKNAADEDDDSDDDSSDEDDDE